MRKTTPDRDTTIRAAAAAGKIRAADADRYRAMYDADPASIHRLLTAKVEEGGLMPGIVPAEDAVPDDAYERSWLTGKERSALETRQAPTPPPAAPAPTTAAVPTEADGEYPDGWLTGEERERIAAAKEGRLDRGPVEFEDDQARRAATAGAGQ